MKSLLLTFILLGLVAVLKAQELPTDDQEDYSGTWYPKATIYNGSLPSYKIPSKVFPVKVTAVEGGDLEADIIFWKNGQCQDIKIMMKKTKEPGKYTSFHGKKSIYITQLPVKDHYIFYCEAHHHGKLFGMGKLMGRNPEENPEAMKEFKKFVQRKGLKEEDILVPELKVSPLQLQGPVSSPRVARPCLRSLLREGLSRRCDGVMYRALLTPGLLLVSTEHCVPESD
ncbi:LOW QUALITY PROTEIN: odorant-binding protein 2a-like [Arvicola amphibius]|uniref:LOW QUALITY PROTEIN: odorant-binding protein 2a-like n=1 Tax=Arvicola amphibius TaxID=1047088 RepID=UPI001C0941BE|nr:LOW QUALITY PROTEIN: odorant-binding protein 2a-like [Arvicola amphibius]